MIEPVSSVTSCRTSSSVMSGAKTLRRPIGAGPRYIVSLGGFTISIIGMHDSLLIKS